MQRNQVNGLFPTQSNFSIKQDSHDKRKRNLSFSKDQIRSRQNSLMLQKTKNYAKQKLVTPQLQSLVNKIQIFVDDIDGKIQNRVQLVKQVYLNEYKQQVLEMATQLKRLREKLDNQMVKQKANEKMFYLEEQRDFFRHEVIKLNEQMKELNQENKLLRRKIEEQKRQVSNYKQVVYNLESKLLKLKNINIQRSKMFQTGGIPNANKNQPSTIDTKKGALTQRGYNKTMKSLQTIHDQSEVSQVSDINKLRASHSVKAYPKVSPQLQKMRSTINYPRLTVQKLQKIEGYSQLLQRQQIFDQCLNEIKKQIYYRNLSIGEKETRMHFNIEDKVDFKSFTKTDKKQLIVKLISHQKILDQFYQFLFNNSNKQEENQLNANQLINSKLNMSSSNGLKNKYSLSKLKFSDARFNTSQLNSLKTQFNKKIFDIKHNR